MKKICLWFLDFPNLFIRDAWFWFRIKNILFWTGRHFILGYEEHWARDVFYFGWFRIQIERQNSYLFKVR